MARGGRLQQELPDEFLEQLERMGKDTKEIMDACLKAGAEMPKERIKQNISSSFKSDENIMSGFGVTSPYEVSNGDRHIKIGFSGYMTNRYGKIVAIPLVTNQREYGNSKETKKPFFRKSFKTEEILNAMQKAFDEEVAK